MKIQRDVTVIDLSFIPIHVCETLRWWLIENKYNAYITSEVGQNKTSHCWSVVTVKEGDVERLINLIRVLGVDESKVATPRSK